MKTPKRIKRLAKKVIESAKPHETAYETIERLRIPEKDRAELLDELAWGGVRWTD